MTSAFHGRRPGQQLWAKQILDELEFIHSKCCPSKSWAGQFSGELIEYELWWIINQVLKWRNIPFCFLCNTKRKFSHKPGKKGWLGFFSIPLTTSSAIWLKSLLGNNCKIVQSKKCPMAIWARMSGSHVGYYSDFITKANNITTQHITSLIFHFVR